MEHFVKYIHACDIEATGLDPYRNEPIVISLSTHDYQSLDKIDEIELRKKPDNVEWWSEEAQKVHGITLQDAMMYDSTDYVTSTLKQYLEPYGIGNAFSCHALRYMGYYYDYGFLMCMMANEYFFFRQHCSHVISTVDIYKDLVKKGYMHVPNFKLDTLCKFFDIELDHHDAKSDRIAHVELLKKSREF